MELCLEMVMGDIGGRKFQDGNLDVESSILEVVMRDTGESRERY